MKLYKEKYGQAFSLVEMLMALLVASLLLAALAPVITRRMDGENINVAGSGEKVNLPERYQCWDYNHIDLQPDPDGSLLRVLDVPSNTAYTFNFIIASGGGGELVLQYLKPNLIHIQGVMMVLS